jgi:hypothetical protein
LILELIGPTETQYDSVSVGLASTSNPALTAKRGSRLAFNIILSINFD